MADKKEPGLFRNAALRPPQIDELSDIAKSLGVSCTEKEMVDIAEHIEGFCKGYDVVDSMVAPSLEVKYPRTPGYRPQPEDNNCNAWYWKCDIPGAAEGLLKGKTVGIKDSVCVAGVPMTNGSKIMEDFVPDIDASVVTRILDAGGRIIGKTNCEHMCFSGSSWTNDTGATLNPHDKSRSAGGSSSGSAVAVHNGEIDMAIGGDQGGSVRIPSSWCGIVGLKPTWGLIPYTGSVPIEITCDHLGPMTRTISDCALMLEAIAGYDKGRDHRQPRDLQVPKYSQLLSGDIAGKKIGLVTEGFANCEEDVQQLVREAAQKLTSVGAIVEEVSIPIHANGVAIWSPICVEGAYKCMVQGAGAGYHYKGYYGTSIMDKLRSGYATKSRNLSETMKVVMLLGEFISRNYGNKFYGKAQNLNMLLTEKYDEALEMYDVLIMPTLPYKAPLLPKSDWSTKEKLENALGMIQNTAPFDATGHPALTMNAGMSAGLPVGMMVVGKSFDETSVLQVAYAYENIRDGK